MRACWCGATDLGVFNADYAVCARCGTLVSRASVSNEQLLVHDDDHDFYGKQYWLKHQSAELGLPDIRARARADLVERNLHWMRMLLRYRLPPAKTLELGCAHGSFVALMRQAGYDASGVELSPWVVQFGRTTFGVPIDVGPLEDMEVEKSSLDVIVAMDVLEHLPDPIETMTQCLARLKADGTFMIQMPRFEIGMTYEALLEAEHPFLSMLQPEEHLYLYSAEAARHLFAQLGVHYLAFEPAIFDQYDMCFVASREPLSRRPVEEGEAALASTPGGVIVRALLDLSGREASWRSRFHEADADRQARGLDVSKLSKTLAEAESDRKARKDQVEKLTATLLDAEKDREARGADLAKFDQLLKQVEADRAARGRQIEVLTADLRRVDTDRSARGEQVDVLTAMVKAAEADRAKSAAQLEQISTLLAEVEVDRTARLQQIVELSALLEVAEADRLARGQQIEILTKLLETAELDRAARGAQIEELTRLLTQAHGKDAA